jgi:hypothetical protein
MTPWKKKYLSNLVHPKTVSFLIEKKYLVSHVWCPILRNTKIYVSIHLDHIIRSSFTQYSDIESRSHPPSRIDPQSRIRVPISWSHFSLPRNQGYPKMAVLFWEIRGTWMLIPWDLDHPPNHVGHARRHRRRNHYLRASSDSPKNLYSSWPCSVKQLNSGG